MSPRIRPNEIRQARAFALAPVETYRQAIVTSPEDCGHPRPPGIEVFLEHAHQLEAAGHVHACHECHVADVYHEISPRDAIEAAVERLERSSRP